MQRNVRKNSLNYNTPSYDPIVSSQAMEFWQNDSMFIANRSLPVIYVPTESGKLTIVDQGSMNRDDFGKRSGEHTEAKTASLKINEVDFDTDTRAVQFVLSAKQAQQLQYKFGANVPQIVPKALGLKANIHTEGRFASLLTSGNAYRTITGASSDSGTEGTTSMNRIYWSDKTKDPVPGIFAEKRLFLLNAGVEATTLRCGYKAFEALATNPYVRQQILGGSVAAVMMLPIATEQQLSTLLGLKVVVSKGVKNTAAEGLAATNSFIVTPEDALLSFDAEGVEATAAMSETGPTVNLNGQPMGLARVVYNGVAPTGMSVRNVDRPEIGAYGSTSWIMDISQGFKILDPKMIVFFDGISQ
jgi:hypothetical protein